MSVAVTVERLHKSFGSMTALHEVDLIVPAGEVVCLIGPSGSGKSTLLRCINGLETPDSGSVVLFGGEQAQAKPRRWSLGGRRSQSGSQDTVATGMVFQSFNLFAHLTALENIALAPIRVKRVPKAVAHQEARKLLERVGLANKADAYPAQLSGGQQQRVAIARALAMHPRVILFDEPTSALDPETISEVLDVIRGLAHSGMTLLIATHEMGFAREVGDRVIFMDAGQILEDRAPADLFDNPQTARCRDFLAKILSSRGTEMLPAIEVPAGDVE